MMARATETTVNERMNTREPADQRKKEEFRTWLFLALIMAPVLAVVIVSGFGFGVWFYQLIAGPPTV
jgi:nitrate reductase NapE